jgi:hypothetical protein
MSRHPNWLPRAGFSTPYHTRACTHHSTPSRGWVLVKGIAQLPCLHVAPGGLLATCVCALRVLTQR